MKFSVDNVKEFFTMGTVNNEREITMRDHHDKQIYRTSQPDQVLILLVVFMGYVFINLLLEAF